MKSKINQILKEIDNKKEDLKKEYLKLREKYHFSLDKGEVEFEDEAVEKNKSKRNSIIDSIFSTEIRVMLSAPFIYSMIIPVLLLDLFLFIYQNVAFRLYKIPLAKRNDFITYDRKKLDYLNGIQKFNCLYCAYVNGFLSYAVEVAGRTEKYWCPIKHAKKMNGGHAWQKHFSDYGDPEGFKETFCSVGEYYKEDKDNILKDEKDITEK